MSEDELRRFTRENSSEWTESFREGLDGLIESLEGFLSENVPAVPIDPNAFTMEDDSTFEDLSPAEQAAAMKISLDFLGVDLEDEKAFVRQYWTESSDQPRVPGRILIRVFKTNRTDDDGIYLHERKNLDGAVRLCVGRDEDMK